MAFQKVCLLAGYWVVKKVQLLVPPTAGQTVGQKALQKVCWKVDCSVAMMAQ
jgi:hypothetical protein